MELRQIERLMRAMKETNTSEVSIKKDGVEVTLKRGGNELPAQAMLEAVLPMAQSAPLSPLHSADAGALPLTKQQRTIMDEERVPESAEPKSQPGNFITSPMVGTFYSASGPGEDAFVKVGDQVKEDTVVCIVEAMKVMNEVKAGMSGIVEEILVDDAHPVEFGSKLFRIV